jgi:hypothetical protein
MMGSDTSSGIGTCPHRSGPHPRWCGARHGRVVTRTVRSPVRPATRGMRVVSRGSTRACQQHLLRTRGIDRPSAHHEATAQVLLHALECTWSSGARIDGDTWPLMPGVFAAPPMSDDGLAGYTAMGAARSNTAASPTDHSRPAGPVEPPCVALGMRYRSSTTRSMVGRSGRKVALQASSPFALATLPTQSPIN